MAKAKKLEGNKILINSSVLNKALKEVGAAIENNLTLPITGYVHCVASPTSLELMTTNMALTIVTKVQCECSGEFIFLMPHKEMYKLMSAIPDQPIEMAIGETIVLNIGRGKDELGIGAKAEFFPKKKELENKYSFKADKSFISAMNLATKCVLSAEIGSIFENVCLHGDGKKISVVSCDKHQLFRYIDEITGAKMKVMVDSKFIKAINHLEEAEISGNDEYILAKSGDTEIITRLAEGSYADYSPYYPEYNTNVVISTKDLALAMNKILSFDNKVHHSILEFKEKSLSIKYDDVDFNRHSITEMESDHKGDIAPVCVDCSILKNLLSTVKSDTVNVYIESSNNPVHIDSETENLTLIIMPLAFQN